MLDGFLYSYFRYCFLVSFIFILLYFRLYAYRYVGLFVIPNNNILIIILISKTLKFILTVSEMTLYLIHMDDKSQKIFQENF